jgi:hypothetical protein
VAGASACSGLALCRRREVLLEAQYKRTWVIFLGRVMSKAQFVRYAGRYIRRPPIAEYRLERISDREVEYLVKDTRKKRLVNRRYSNEEFVDVLKDHVPERFQHGMRYFGLLSPRSKHLTFPALFALLGQKKRTRPRRLSWADSLYRHSGSTLSWTAPANPCAGSAVSILHRE